MGSWGKTLALLLVALFLSLIALGAVCILPVNAQFQGIIINADGSITPSTAPIQQSSNTYTLTSNIGRVEFFLQKSNMIFDGNGHTIGDGVNGNIIVGTYDGSVPVTNLTIQNLHMQSTTDPIAVYNSSNIIIKNNTLIGGGDTFGQTSGVFTTKLPFSNDNR